MRRLSGIAVAAGLLVATSVPASSQAMPSGYRVWRSDQSVDFSLAQDSPAAFHAIVSRRAGAVEDEWRLRLAESLYPSRESMGEPQVCDGVVPPENAWWAGCEPRVPFALTASAVRYYLDRIGALRRGEVRSRGQPLRSGGMRYDASGGWEAELDIAGERFRDVYVVRLQLDVHMRCGELCGWSFRKERVVVLSRAGDVLFVTGDGRTALRVK